MYTLWDYVCICGVECERLVSPGEVVHCPFCLEPMTKQLFTRGTAARAEANPSKTREMFAKAQEMRNKVHGRTPWRRSSYSQTGNS